MLSKAAFMDAMQAISLDLSAEFGDQITNYVYHGVRPGRFVYTVLCNDMAVFFRLNDDEMAAMAAQLLRFISNDAPEGCWGSGGRVALWMDRGGLLGNPGETSAPRFRPVMFPPVSANDKTGDEGPDIMKVDIPLADGEF